MQALCQLDAQASFLDQLDAFLADEQPPPAVQDYARELVQRVQTEMSAIDEHIQNVLDNWDIKRISMVDRNILRMAVCELLHQSAAVPEKVALNEAVEISKEFGTAESPGFVNGVLDAVIKRRLPSAADSTPNPTTENSTT